MADSDGLKDLYEFADFAIDSDEDDDDNDDDIGMDNIDIDIDDDDDPLGVLMEKAAQKKISIGGVIGIVGGLNAASGNVNNDVTSPIPSGADGSGHVANDHGSSGASEGLNANTSTTANASTIISASVIANANGISSSSPSLPGRTTSVAINSSTGSGVTGTGTGTGTGTAASALRKKTVSATEDPLSAFNASSSIGIGIGKAASTFGFGTSHTNTGTNVTSSSYPQNNPMAMAMGMAPQSLSASTSTATSTSTNPYPISSEAAAAASQSVAKIVSKTQSFTSTFSSFASKFSDAVSNAASSVPPGTVPGSGSGIVSTSATAMAGVNSSLASASFAERSALLPARNMNGSGSGSGIGIGGIGGSNGNVTGMEGGQASGPTVYGVGTQNANVNGGNGTSGMSGSGMEQTTPGQGMDKGTKSAVLKSAIGSLLPGERVLMFLSNLQNVKETSSPQTGIGSVKLHQRRHHHQHQHQHHQHHQHHQQHSANEEEVWCCAMTFYRLLVFSYRKSDFPKDSTNANAGGTSASSSTSIAIGSVGTNMNVNVTNDGVVEEGEEIAQWEKSASVSRQFQNVNNMRSIQRSGGKYHQIMTMPLASIDRVEKTTEFTPSSSNLSFASSSIMGNSSQYHDSLGGSVASGTLVVHGKNNGRFIQFTAPSYADCMGAYQALNTYAFPGRRNLGYLFAFESRREEVLASVKNLEGEQSQSQSQTMSTNKNAVGRMTSRATPRRYDALSEFQRMVHISSDMPCPWRPFMKANATYNLCQSYPSIMFGPSSINDETPEGMRLLRETAAFRSGQRFQSLSWASKYDGASLWRCAQPRVGLQGNRNVSDEIFIKKIGECAAFANTKATANGKTPPRPSMEFLKMLTGGINGSDLMLDSFRREGAAAVNDKCIVKIFDLRPKSSAMANRTAGYGYENTSYYKNTTLSFHGIGNIHAVRDAYQKLSALCSNPSANDVQWTQLVEETKWLSLTRLILSVSWQAAFHVRYNRMPVLLHCSHGWDRTSQVCALSQIFLDPYYRTRVGFSCLVEKDFLALGHPFHLRCGHGEGRGDRNNNSGSSGSQVDEGQMSPIFIQFLDCVFQIVNQYPDYFEFNSKYLLLISEHVYSCRFGTLLCDTEREREVVASIRQRTHCLWEYLDSAPELVNKSYKYATVKVNDAEESGTLLMPLPSLLRNVTLWVDRFCMHGAKPTVRCFPPDLSDCNSITNGQTDTALLGAESLTEKALNVAQSNASRWKHISKQKDQEIFELKQKLKLYQDEVQIREEKQTLA